MFRVAFALLVLACVASADVTCSDGSSCPSGNTCCKTGTGGYGCCSTPDATCCSDHIHCCPPDYPICDMSHSQCKASSSLTAIPMMSKVAQWENVTIAKPQEPQLESVECGDGSSCPDGNTCCQSTDGSYGCCPVDSATCCADHIHCCPPEYPVCDLAHGECTSSLINNKDKKSTPFMTRVSAVRIEDQPLPDNLQDIECDDGSTCPDDSTCCPSSDGSFGCCPVSDATCCSDETHCCPPDYPVCDVSGGQCVASSSVSSIASASVVKAVPWLVKQQSKSWVRELLAEMKVEQDEIKNLKKASGVKDIQCDDGSSCPDDSTCCPSPSGGYGCCPTPNATCCSDQVHCCPSDFPVCDLTRGECTSSALSFRALRVPALKHQKSLNVTH